VNRDGYAAFATQLGLAVCLVLGNVCVSDVSGQIGQSRQSSVKTVSYVYNGTQYTIITIAGQPAQVRVGTQVVLMFSGGNVIPFPGVDAHLVANVQDAVKAFQAGTPSGSAAAAPPAGGQKSGLTVDGVVTMLNAGISEDVIIERIHKSGQSFDLTPDEMVALKKAKASDNLMKAMMESGGGTSGAAAAAPVAASSAPSSSTQPVPAPATQTTAPAAQPTPAPAKKKGFFGSIGESVKDEATGRSVIDKVGLRNVLPQLDPNKPVSEQWPHVAITVLNAPMGWTDPYRTDKSAQGRSIVSSCFKLQAVVWTDATTSKTVGPFDWCSAHDEFMAQLEPDYLQSLRPTFADVRSGYLTGINRTDGPAPPDKLLPNDRRTLDMWAKTSPQGRSVDLNTDQYSRFALMFANVRKDLGETLTSDGDARVWVVTIQKAAGPNILQ
jgi:hypothetical protein